jgi:hypothetical protein
MNKGATVNNNLYRLVTGPESGFIVQPVRRPQVAVRPFEIKSNIHIMRHGTTSGGFRLAREDSALPEWTPPHPCSLHLTRIDVPSHLRNPRKDLPRPTSFHLAWVVSAARRSAPPIPSHTQWVHWLSEWNGHMSITTRPQ